MVAALLIDAVSVDFGGFRAVSEVRTSFGPGVTGLLGHNGAGKSTLMSVIAGLQAPSSGRVLVDGDDVDARAATREMLRSQLGMLPQRFGYFPGFTVREFLEYAAWLRRMPRAEVPAAVSRALELVRLSDRREVKLKALSGGMLQRVGIATAVVHRPRVLILDEPSNGLDIEQRDVFRSIVRDLEPDTITILSSHLAEDIAAVCERVIVLRDGRVVADAGTAELVGARPGECVSGPQLEQAYLRVLGVIA